MMTTIIVRINPGKTNDGGGHAAQSAAGVTLTQPIRTG